MSALSHCLFHPPALPSRGNRLRYPLWETLVSASRFFSAEGSSDAPSLIGVTHSSRIPLKKWKIMDGRRNYYGLECSRNQRSHVDGLRRQRLRKIGTSFTQSLSIRLDDRRHSFGTTPHRFHLNFSTLPNTDSDSDSDGEEPSRSDRPASSTSDHRRHSHHPCHPRLLSLRNVGIFAHVDAGKTTVTERMLALSGLVRDPGSVDDGDTVTDYLPAERERGITIQSAAVGFDWVVPPASHGSEEPRSVAINLIDTPGHVDFSVEVHRSVAVLDGAVLVVDAVAGVQAQTETVWRAIRNTDETASSGGGTTNRAAHGSHAHEPLPALMFINKMDREGADFRHAIDSVRRRLRGSNPVAVQLPLYRVENHGGPAAPTSDSALGPEIAAGSPSEAPPHGEFVGLVDLVRMRAIVYPDDAEDLSMEDAAPSAIPLHSECVRESNPALVATAAEARRELISSLADVDEIMEDLYLHAEMEEEETTTTSSIYDSCSVLRNISTEQIQSSLRRMTLSRLVMPTMCGAALRGVGVEPVSDCVAEYLPCPLDRASTATTVGQSTAQKETSTTTN